MDYGFALAFICAGVDWIAVAKFNKRLEYVFKPATMLVVILTAYLAMQSSSNVWLARWFIVGFAFSLVGDVILMLPDRKYFILGLGAFLLAHFAYIIGLNPTLPPAAAFLLLIPCALAVGLVTRRVVRALSASEHRSLVAPVIVYGIAMTLMLFSAWATLFRPDWGGPQRAFVIIGATLFFISDAILASNRFVKPILGAELGIIITYHLAQIALAASIG